MAKWKWLIVNEDGEIEGTNEEEQARRYSESACTVINLTKAEWSYSDWDSFEEITEAREIPDEDEEEADDAEESDE